MRRFTDSQDVRAVAIGCAASATAAVAAAPCAWHAERRALRRTVGEVMSEGVTTVRPDDSVADAAERMAEAELGALPVCDERRHLLGMLTDRDIVVRVVAQGERAADLPVAECLTGEPVSVAADATLDEALRRMSEHAVRRLPVMRDGRVAGMLSERDVLLHVPRRRSGAALRRTAQAPGDRQSGAWLFRRAHGPADGDARLGERRRRADAAELERYARDAMRDRDARIA